MLQFQLHGASAHLHGLHGHRVLHLLLALLMVSTCFFMFLYIYICIVFSCPFDQLCDRPFAQIITCIFSVSRRPTVQFISDGSFSALRSSSEDVALLVTWLPAISAAGALAEHRRGDMLFTATRLLIVSMGKEDLTFVVFISFIF